MYVLSGITKQGVEVYDHKGRYDFTYRLDHARTFKTRSGAERYLAKRRETAGDFYQVIEL